MKKRLLSIVLILCILATTIYIPNKSFAVSVGDKNTYEGIQAQIPFELVKGDLPLGTKEYVTVKGQKLKLNTELWVDKNIVVYGDYTIANPSKNDYRRSTQNPNKRPYYEYGQGEYRYHGYTVEGNKYTNIHFINDANSSKELQEKKWIHNPWNSNLIKQTDRPIMSQWNRYAIVDNNTIAKQWINKAFDWEITNGTTASVRDKAHYINVLTPPTTYSAGEGRMWHWSSYSNKPWYQTFSINPIAANIKRIPPVSTTIKILDKDKLVLNPDMDSIKVKVEVEGVLDDSICYDGKDDAVDKTTYYHRDDIKNWEFNLSGTHIGNNNKGTEDRKNAPNKGIKVYEFTLTRTQIEQSNELTFSVNTNAVFKNGEKSNSATAKDTATIKFDKNAPKGFKSLFTVNNDITIDNKTIFLKEEHIKYKNGSYGDIARYSINIRNQFTEEIKTVNITGSKINEIEIDKAIFEIMNKHVKDKSEGTYSFEVVQTAFNKKGDKDDHTEIITVTIKQPPSPPVVITHSIDAEPDIPDYAFDIVPFKPTISGDLSKVTEKSVLVDGVEVDFDYFFSGNFTFGESDVDRIVPIGVSLGAKGSTMSKLSAEYVRWVRVLTTKPKVQYSLEGIYKQNRKMTATNTSDNANDPLLLYHYPISYEWKFEQVDGDNSSFRIRNSGDLYKEFLYKKPGQYRIILNGQNDLGRKSEPYVLEIFIHEDYQPTVEWHIWNNVLARNEEFNMHHEVASTDGDKISKNVIEIWYDSNDDGVPDQKLLTVNAKDFKGYKPSKLGSYKVINYIEEDFGEETLLEFITPLDKVKRTVEREVFVDNLAPMTQIYVEEYAKFPEIDVFIMNDKDLARSKNDVIRNSRIDYTNYLRNNSLAGKVEVWDMYTYVYSQPASTTRNTGGSYPPTTTSYSSGGYSGTLNRYNVSNNDYWVDTSYYKTVEETTTKEIMHYTETTREQGWPGPPWDIWDAWGETVAWYYYETVTETTTKQVLVSDGYWQDDYTGFYSGTIYKNVRQPYTDPFRPSSDKYIIYVSDGGVNEIWDLRATLDKADARLILIGADSIKSQIPHHHFIKNTGGNIEDLVKQALNKIIQENPYNLQYTILKNEELKTNVVDIDDENDPIVEKKFQYVQNVNYYDNSDGLFSLATQTLREDKWIDTKVSSYNKVGHYQMIRRVKDSPLEKPSLWKFSNQHLINIYVHRKPIALATLDWTYDVSKASYKTTWVGKSYDLDHQFKRADKGIVDRKIKFRKVGGEWNYRIPDYLEYGSYNLEYYVKDVEGVWSDPFIMNFTLQQSPPMQFDAKARTLDSSFRMTSIPASEKLELYDVWTRYPYNVKLEVAMFQGTTQKTTTQTINFSSTTGTKVGSDINWKNIVHTIPATLPDGNYTLRITAIGDGGQTAQKNFPVTVKTPINLKPEMEVQVITTDDTFIKGETTKYADTVTVQLYLGHPFTTNLSLSGTQVGNLKNWVRKYTVPGTIPDGIYIARYTATTPNGNKEVKDVSFKVESLKISGHLKPNPAMAGDQILFFITTEGYADKIEIVVPNDLIAMDKRVSMGYPAVTYPSIFFNVDKTIMEKEDILDYIVWVSTEDTLGKNNVRLRQPYKFTVRAYKGTVTREIELELDIKGSILELLKPGIKNKNGK